MTNPEDSDKGVLIYGGTFNPLHIGHLRMAITAFQTLAEYVEKVDFVPARLQPLKKRANVLPFEWRRKMIELSVEGFFNLQCNDIENQRSGPSYTYDTLKDYPGLADRDKRFFLLGSEDFAQIDKWHRGEELPLVTNFVVAPRHSYSFGQLLRDMARLWPDMPHDGGSLTGELKKGDYAVVTLHNGGKIFYIDLPYLDISSTAIRQAWLKNANISWLVPFAVERLLEKNRQLVTSIWGTDI